jgi:Mannosylglycerate hydrolase MGH1-like glycoside hydrolase domain
MNSNNCTADRFSARLMLLLVWLHVSSHVMGQAKPQPAAGLDALELSGPAVPWRFINAVGEKAGIWGSESGVLEGWVYPLKLFHDFNLEFQLEGSPTIYPGEQLIRAVRVRPESVDLQYSAERFSVKETLYTPRHEAGFVILLEAKTPAPLHVFVRFRPDLNLMWPGSVGGQVAAWNSKHNWMELSEPSGKFSAVIGSPAAVGSTAVGYHSYLTNDQPYEQIELRIDPNGTQGSQIPIIATGGISNIYHPAEIYASILNHLPQLYSESVKHYADLDGNGPQVFTPDPAINSALRWSRVSLDQLKVCNPYLGCGYASGYGSSGTGTRPMYAWFFDEPNITERAFAELGQAESMREAFRFIQKFQRGDGQIPHEISQSAGAIDWFKNYPYPYIHSDTCLWYLIAMGHFYTFTGDRAFLSESWSSIKKAYGYCLSLLNKENGLPVIPPESWGSMETAGVATQDSAMAGEWIAALRALATLAAAMNDSPLTQECRQRAKLASDSLEKLFWNPTSGYYNYGVGKSGEKVTYLNPAIAYSVWFGSLPQERAQPVLERLATAQFLSDWGVRSMSLEDPRYDEGSYQVGSAWPFFTAASMLGDYRYHNAVQGYLTWMSMIHLRTFNERGSMPESLSGSYYRLLENGVPHQMFSELVAMPGLIEGVLGLDVDAPGRMLHLTPHLPPAWPDIAVRQFPFGQGRLNIQLHQTPGRLSAELDSDGAESSELMFWPALPPGATAYSVKVQGKSVPFQMENNGSDIHVKVNTEILSKTSIEVFYRGGIAMDVPWQPLLEGDTSRNLHVLKSSYQNGQFQMLVEGRPDVDYQIRLWTPWKIATASSAKSIAQDGDWSVLRIVAPADAKQHLDKAGYTRWTVVVSIQ